MLPRNLQISKPSYSQLSHKYSLMLMSPINLMKSSSQVHLDVGEGTIKYSTQWLLNQLIVYLQHHMTYKCIHNGLGTGLFRTGGDLLTIPFWALGRASVENTNQVQVILEQKDVATDAHKEKVPVIG